MRYIDHMQSCNLHVQLEMYISYTEKKESEISTSSSCVPHCVIDLNEPMGILSMVERPTSLCGGT